MEFHQEPSPKEHLIMIKQSFLALLLLALGTAGLNAFEVTIDNFAAAAGNTTVFTKTLGGIATTTLF